MNTLPKYLPVLLADDDMDDRTLFSEAVTRIKVDIDLQLVKDGAELMDYLKNSAIIMPEIIFLDLNMPRVNGFECLAELKSTAAFKDIFVIIYSTTQSQKDIDEVYRLKANLFVRKPDSFSDLKNTLYQILTINVKEQFTSGTMQDFVFKATPLSK